MVRILEVPSIQLTPLGEPKSMNTSSRELSPGVSSGRKRAFCMPQLSRSPVSASTSSTSWAM